MLSLDLFDSRYERELREGAVDDLEHRRIDDLNAKMQDLLARAQNASPETKAGLKREFDKVKDERDSYFKVRNETMQHDSLGEAKADYNFDAEDLKRLERIRDLPTLKAQAFELISRPSAKPMKPEKVEWFKNALEKMNSPLKVIKLMYDLLLSGEGHAVVGSKASMNPNSYRQRFGEEETNQAGIPGNVPTEKIPGKEELLKGRGRTYYEDQKKSSESLDEHGGGIGPRQHWQDLMQEGQPLELMNRYLAIDAENDVDAVRQAIQAISKDPSVSDASKIRLLGQLGMIIRRYRLPIGRAYYQFMQQYMEDINETALNPKDPQSDYEAKRRALHDLSLNKDVDQAAVLQRRLDLDREAKAKGLAETVTNVKAGMAEIYRRLAPKIERHRDSFLAGQLYDELENYAELHGAEGEFKRMMSTARNRAHMEYDTNPGGFQNWFWFLPFEDDAMTEGTDELKKKMSKLEALALAANRAGDDAKCKMYQQKIQSLKQKLSQAMVEGLGDSPVAGAITRRIMSQHLDLLKQYGPELVGAAVDDVADYVGDVDEIGSSDVSGWVAQVERMLRENPPEAFAEGWSDQGNPTAYSVYIDGREWRAYKSDEHARAVAEKVRANLTRQGRDQTVTIAPSKNKHVQENISRQPRTARERDEMIDKIQRMMAQDRNPANLQIMRKDIEMLRARYRDLKEDSDSNEAVEMAIIRRMLVAHTDLIVEFGLDRVVAAIEEVAYDVGDVDEIGSSDVSGWVRQVERILGADA